MDQTRSVIASARSFFAGSLLSRCSGLFRDVATAAAFGATAEVAAFLVAFRLSNLFRRLLGEGNVQAGFIPQFTALKERGIFFYRDTVFSLGIVLLLAVALLELGFWILGRTLSPEWGAICEMSLWMAPGLFFICLYGLNTAFMQCQKKYFLPSVAPVAFNFVWGTAAFFVDTVQQLAIVVTFAFMAQWALTVAEGFRHLHFSQWLRPKLFSSEFRSLLKPLTLGMIGVGAVQINSALDPIFARMADLKGPAYLWFAIRIEQLPFALFGLALSSALLPALSRTEDEGQKRLLLQNALQKATGLMLFCTFGLFALGPSGVNLLYGHGDFSSHDVQETLHCLWGYGFGLAPSVFVLLLAARFFSEKQYRLPALASLYSVIANVALNALFVFAFGWGAASIALSTSLSAFFNAALLARGAFTKSFWIFALKMGAACLAASLAVIAIPVGELSRAFSLQLMQFGALSFVYLAVLYVLIFFESVVRVSPKK